MTCLVNASFNLYHEKGSGLCVRAACPQGRPPSGSAKMLTAPSCHTTGLPHPVQRSPSEPAVPKLVENYIYIYIYICVCVCVNRFQNVFLRCPTPRLHCFLSSHWPSFRFLSFMTFLIPSIQFFFGPPRALFCIGIHFNAILGNLPSAILWTWPHHVSWFCSVSFIFVSSGPVCFIATFPST